MSKDTSQEKLSDPKLNEELQGVIGKALEDGLALCMKATDGKDKDSAIAYTEYVFYSMIGTFINDSRGTSRLMAFTAEIIERVQNERIDQLEAEAHLNGKTVK